MNLVPNIYRLRSLPHAQNQIVLSGGLVVLSFLTASRQSPQLGMAELGLVLFGRTDHARLECLEH